MKFYRKACSKSLKYLRAMAIIKVSGIFDARVISINFLLVIEVRAAIIPKKLLGARGTELTINKNLLNFFWLWLICFLYFLILSSEKVPVKTLVPKIFTIKKLAMAAKDEAI